MKVRNRLFELKMEKLYLSLAIACTCSIAMILTSCGAVNYLSGPKVIHAEPVEPGEPGVPGNPAEQPEATYHDLFSFTPGTSLRLSSYAGTVDPVGTTLVNDFDGDGIENSRETTSNVWVADYPAVETDIATPVTMSIEILYESDTKTETITTDITAEDTTRAQDYSTDAIHRDEVNMRTVQYQDEMAKAHQESHEEELAFSASAEGGWGAAKVSVSGSKKVADSFSDSFSEKKTYWKDVPFKNNTERNGWAIKGSEAAKNARNLRQEIREKGDVTTKIKPNAGYIRAALTITNNSVNMPVRLTNILCSLMFQTPQGNLLPVQSFRLRQDDYSIFSINLYGSNTFGPYVIELSGLNTMEIKEAISRGYNPKIFIIDYDMYHVEDSNYRQALSDSFTGDNLKIIEENAKGRTAGIRIIGPGFRNFYRVVAFDTDLAQESRSTQASEVKSVKPGVTIRKALQRISYSGIAIEFANYVLDFSNLKFKNGTQLAKNHKFFARGIKSINGVETNIPVEATITEPDGSITYVMKPFPWTNEEYAASRMWMIYGDGKYYMPQADAMVVDAKGAFVKYEDDYVYNGQRIVKMQGISGPNSIIWPGDHYDIVLFDFSDYIVLKKDFGNNPLESEKEKIVKFNTVWNRGKIWNNYFDPNVNSQCMGDIALGDTVELTIKLNDTTYLNPKFGVPEQAGYAKVYKDFTYAKAKSNTRFDLPEAVDFEINLGLGGDYTSWFNLIPSRSPLSMYYNCPDEQKILVTDTYWDYLNQTFTVRLRIPDDLPGVAPNGAIKLYLRTALNNAYRETIWPRPYREVKKFRGILGKQTAQNSTVLRINSPVGDAPAVGEDLRIASVSNGVLKEAAYDIQAATPIFYKGTVAGYDLTLASPLAEPHAVNEEVYINLARELTESEVRIAIDDGFVTDFNAAHGDNPLAIDTHGHLDFIEKPNDQISLPRILGFETGVVETNWMGNNGFGNPNWNGWMDPVYLSRFQNPTGPILTYGTKSVGFEMGATRLVPLSDETPLSSTYQGTMAKTDKYILVVYPTDTINTANSRIAGCIADFSSGIPKWSPAFMISGTAGASNPHVAAAGNTAIVTWDSIDTATSTSKLTGRIIDLDKGKVHEGNELVIDPGISVGSDVEVYGNYALAIYIRSGNQLQLCARVIDLTTNTLLYTPLVINTVSGGGQMTIYGSHALVVYPTGGYYGLGKAITCSFLDLSAIASQNPTLSGPALQLSTNTTETKALSFKDDSIYIFGTRALVTWQYFTKENILDDVIGRVINLSNASPINGEFTVNTQTAHYQTNQVIVPNDNQPLVVWQSSASGTSFDIKGRTIDLKNGGPAEKEEFLISEQTTYDQVFPRGCQLGGKPFVSWFSKTSTGTCNAFGVLVDADNGLPMRETLLQINATPFDLPAYLFQSSSETVIPLGSDRLMFAWQVDNPQRGIVSRIVKKQTIGPVNFVHGLNNFFAAPLIERNYEVSARLINEWDK